jgi:hypothetical protein
MLTISNQTYAALSDSHLTEFVRRCGDFLRRQGATGGRTQEQLDNWIRERLPQFTTVGLTSERSVVLLLCLEGRLATDVLGDPQVAAGLAALPMNEPMRLGWFRSHIAKRLDWAKAIVRA